MIKKLIYNQRIIIEHSNNLFKNYKSYLYEYESIIDTFNIYISLSLIDIIKILKKGK